MTFNILFEVATTLILAYLFWYVMTLEEKLEDAFDQVNENFGDLFESVEELEKGEDDEGLG